MPASLQRFQVADDREQIGQALLDDGGVIVEGLLDAAQYRRTQG